MDIAVSNLRMGMRHRTSQELSIIVNERASMLDSVIFKFSSKALILHWSLQNAGILAQCFEVFTICLIVIFLSNQRAYVVPLPLKRTSKSLLDIAALEYTMDTYLYLKWLCKTSLSTLS